MLAHPSECGGATTDSSGYLSANSDRKRQGLGRANSGQARLLKMCSNSTLVSVPPPPPPPAGAQRDTRQQLSTFRSAAITSFKAAAVAPKSTSLNSSEVSPASSTQSSYSRPGSISSLGPTTSDSSLDLEPVSSTTTTTTNLIPSELSKPGSEVPCPPPMPVLDAEFECKISKQLQLELERSPSGSANNAANESANKSTVKNRLCFVDELKMLAKKSNNSLSAQKQVSRQQQAAAGIELDSSTLIKIINASKATGSGGNCSDCRSRQNESSGKQQQMVICNRDNCSLRSPKQASSSGGAELSAVKSALGGRSAKLNEEDNKRRQHGK